MIPKAHYSSYVFEVPEEIMTNLVVAAKKVGKRLDETFTDVGRTGLLFEGFGVNHLHAKLFPMHGTKDDEWKQHKSDVKVYFEKYQGYLSSHDCERADDERLAALAKRLRGEV